MSGRGEGPAEERPTDDSGSSCHLVTLSPCHPPLPLVEELRPAPDPWEAFRRLAGLQRVLFLDSALAHPSLGRYSFLTADPPEAFWARGPGRGGAGLHPPGRKPRGGFIIPKS